jgi:hypothetical protein
MAAMLPPTRSSGRKRIMILVGSERRQQPDDQHHGVHRGVNGELGVRELPYGDDQNAESCACIDALPSTKWNRLCLIAGSP